MPDTHHKYGPSSLKSREICPKWERSEEEAGEAAQEGTMLHTACETGDVTGLTPEQTYAVNSCVEYVSLIKAEAPAVTDDQKELRLDIHHDGKLLTFGTADRLVLHTSGLCAELVDYKFGRVSVGDADNNIQGQSYAVGVLQMFPSVKNVRVHFLLPRRDEITTSLYSRDDLSRMVLRVATVIARCESKFATETPDTENCLYCARKGRCGALAGTALVYAGKSDAVELPATWNPRAIEDPAVLAVAMRAVPVLEDWCKAVKQEALARVNGGTHIPGYVLRRRSGGREIVNAEGVLTAAMLAGASRPELIDSARWSLTAIKDMIAAKIPHGEKGKVLEAFDAEIAAYTASRPDTEFLQREKKAKE